MKAELIADAKAEVGEGPVWIARQQRLYWVDIRGCSLHVHDPHGPADAARDVGRLVGAAVPCRNGDWLLAGKGGIGRLNPTTGKETFVVDPEPELADNRCNDGKCDARGRFWIGTMSMIRTPGTAGLYCLDVDGTLRRAFGGTTTSNGLAWSADDRTMYFIDTPTLRVEAFDFDAQRGELSNRRTIITFPEGVGRPDGMTIDAEGMLWIAHWEGWRVSRWDPRTGRLLAEVGLPVQRVTSCAFGGPKLDRLFITTARFGLSEDDLKQQPHAGGLFVVEPGVSGSPTCEYAG